MPHQGTGAAFLQIKGGVPLYYLLLAELHHYLCNTNQDQPPLRMPNPAFYWVIDSCHYRLQRVTTGILRSHIAVKSRRLDNQADYHPQCISVVYMSYFLHGEIKSIYLNDIQKGGRVKRVALHIQKGGVGKSSISGHVAWAAAESGVDTVLIDSDPQANASSWFISDQIQFELADVLAGRAKLDPALVPIRDNLRILPTFAIGGDLQRYDDAATMYQQPHLFGDLCESLEAMGVQLAMFDLSPGMGTLEQSIIKSLDEVITPLTPEFFSLDGIEIFRESLAELNKNQRTNVVHRRIVANMINRSFRRHRDIVREFEKMDYQLFEIPQDSKIAEGQLYHETVFTYAPKSKAIPELRRLASAIMGA